MAKKKPDVVDTEPPEEARPDTTATPLLVENGKVSPDVEFTPIQLLKVFEYLADKHNKPRLHDAAWGIVQAIDTEDYTTGAEILDIDPAWWEKKAIAQAHVRLIRAVFGNAERLTVFVLERLSKRDPRIWPRRFKHSCKFFYVWTIC